MYNKQFLDEGEQNIAIYQITADILDKRGLVPLYRIAHEQSIVCSKTIKKNNFRFVDRIILAKHCLNTHALPLSSMKRSLNVWLSTGPLTDSYLFKVVENVHLNEHLSSLSYLRFMFMVPFFIYLLEKFDHPSPPPSHLIILNKM